MRSLLALLILTSPVVAATRFDVRGHGTVFDGTHPQRPGDSQRHDITFRISADLSRSDAIVEFTSAEHDVDQYFIRRGRPFQLGANKEEIEAASYGDLSPALIAAIDATFTQAMLDSHRENARQVKSDLTVFAWNDSLWRIHFDRGTKAISHLERSIEDPIHGDVFEDVRYESAQRVTINAGDRPIARLFIDSIDERKGPVVLPQEKEHWHLRRISPEDVVPHEIAPHLFAIDLMATNSRVFVAEFEKSLFVIEGAYNSENCDVIADEIEKRFHKPITDFSFSHLHGQYLGGVRSYAARGAVIHSPPTTSPLIVESVRAPHDYHPDTLSRHPKDAHIQTVPRIASIGDLEIHNVESEHTDEYLIFYFPKQKVLLSGDLLMYRPGQPLRGRSKKLCKSLSDLHIDPEMVYGSWPIEGYGVQSRVSKDELDAACAAATAPATPSIVP